jgi:hypothetical protein
VRQDERRAVGLAVPSAFGMRLEVEAIDPVLCCFHGFPRAVCDNDTEAGRHGQIAQVRV